ncbi:MAG: alpha/beta hydrolase [Actinobacteria bacterium]|nr:MAG: alpha/beta hydrolase [Actinomycetota bacterium]
MRIRMPDESDVQPLDPEYAAAERFVDSILRAAEPKTSERGVRLQEGVVRCARGRVATRRGLVVALVATVAAGCGGSAHKKNIANPRPISFRDSRGSVNGVVYGGGERGIVLANQSDSDRTAWAPFGRLLAKRGYHVLAFDYGFDSPQSDIAAAARALRRLGARRELLIGASKGAKAAVIAAAGVPDNVVGVVSLSAERWIGSEDVLPWARRLRLPALFVTARDDPWSKDDTPLLERATSRAASRRLLVLPGDAHGIDLTSNPRGRRAVLDFVDDRLRDPAAPESLATRCGASTAAPSRTFWFRSRDGLRLDGAVVGSGPTSIVLAHQYPSDLCPWLDYAGTLARSGFRAFLFDFRGFGKSEEAQTPAATWRLEDDVAGAVAEARRQGARHVILVGASMGASAVVAAAPTIRPPVDGVVSLSAEWDLDGLLGSHGLNAAQAAPRLRVPWLVAQTKALAARAGASAHVIAVPDGGHGWSLLEASRRLVQKLADFYRGPA